MDSNGEGFRVMSKQQSEQEGLLKSLGCVWSEDNGAWMHSRHGMGFTSQIEPKLLDEISHAFEARLDKAYRNGYAAGNATKNYHSKKPNGLTELDLLARRLYVTRIEKGEVITLKECLTELSTTPQEEEG